MNNQNQSPPDIAMRHRAYNDPGNFDIWHNPTKHTFYVGVHIKHGEGGDKLKSPPDARYYKFEPGSSVQVPVEHRYAFQVYDCSHPDCKASSGTKLCFKDHPAVVCGGQAPQLIRLSSEGKALEHIRPNPIFSDEWVEVRKVDNSGRTSFEMERVRPDQVGAPLPVQPAAKRREG